jgi:hypothetical protein
MEVRTLGQMLRVQYLDGHEAGLWQLPSQAVQYPSVSLFPHQAQTPCS